MKYLPLVVASLIPCAGFGELKEQLIDQLREELRNENALRDKDGDRSSAFYRYSELLMKLRQVPDGDYGGQDLGTLADQIEIWSSSTKVQEIAKALGREARADQEERAQAWATEVERVAREALKTALAAKTPKDIDDPLVKVSKFARENQYSTRGSRNRELYQQVQQLPEFLRQWQDYLAHVEAGESKQAAQVLRSLAGSVRDFSAFVPRSELIGKLKSLQKEGPEEPKSDTPKDLDNEVAKILRETKTLEDLESTFKKLDALKPGGLAANSGRFYNVLSGLRAINRSYQDLKAGLATNISLGNVASSSSFEGAEELAAMRQQLIMFAIPRLLNLKESEVKPNENVLTVLQSLVAKAKADQNWTMIGKVIDLSRTLNLNSVASSSDSSAMTSFLAGLNQEKAKQYALAVVSYQVALKTGSQLISAELIGEHLAQIKKEHAADYERGIELTLTPPQPASDSRFPSRMSPFPGGFPGRPSETPPAPSSLTVPAAAQKAPEAK